MKRSMKMLLLLAALVLCVGGYCGVQLLNGESAAVTEESGSFALESHGSGDLTSLTWAQGEETYAFACADGAWTVAADPAFPLNQEEMQQMADDLLAVVGIRQLDGVTDLAAYGLAEPAFSVTAGWADGASTTWAMGDETPFGDGYYVSLGHEGIVYTVSEDISDVFDTTLNDLAVLEPLPDVTAVTRLTVGDALDIVKEEASRTINAGEVWYDNLTGAALDAAAADALAADAQELAWGELAEATASDEELTVCGVDEAQAVPVTLYEGETAALTLLVGAQNDEGSYYARLPGSAMVYTVAEDALSPLLTAAADAMPSMVIVDLAADAVQAATFTAGDHTYTWTPEAAPEADAAADAEAADDASSEEAEAADSGAALWAKVLALQADSTVPEATGSVLMTISVTAMDGRSTELTFAEYDAEHYAVSVPHRCLLVDAGETDAIIRSLRTIK